MTIHASFAGNVGNTELKDFNGDRVLEFSVAVNEKRKGVDVVTWVRCTLWGKRAEALGQYVTKGKPVTVWGQLSVREWEKADKRGVSVECRVDDVKLQGGRDDGARPAPALSGRPDEWRGTTATVATGAVDDPNDDIPF